MNQDIAHAAAIDAETYERQQTNAALSLLDRRLTAARMVRANDGELRASILPAVGIALRACTDALHSLGVAS
jgi:hypothetical protein